MQVSTFCCGPDSVTQPLVAEIMKQRPFLLIQSDAVIKELAHLENRVNTYVNQLSLGLHAKLKSAGETPFDIAVLGNLEHNDAIDRDRDVIYFPDAGGHSYSDQPDARRRLCLCRQLRR